MTKHSQIAPRRYFAVQAVAGAAWWMAVWLSPSVRTATLGGLDPRWLVVPDLVLFVFGSAMAARSRRAGWAVSVAVWTVLVTVTLAAYALATEAAGWGAVAMTGASLGSVPAAVVLRRGHLPTAWYFRGPFRFRVAPERSGAGHLVRSLAQLVMVWTLVFATIPGALTLLERRLGIPLPVALPRIGVLLVVAGSGLGLSACVAMSWHGHGTPLPAATARHLVVRGPYRVVRNPMAVAGVAQMVGVGLLLGSWTTIAVAALGAVAWNLGIRPVEEADLARRFGSGFEAYRRRVRCWCPLPARRADGVGAAGVAW